MGVPSSSQIKPARHIRPRSGIIDQGAAAVVGFLRKPTSHGHSKIVLTR